MRHLLPALLLMTGCDLPGVGKECDLMAYASTVVTVTDDSGTPVEGLTLEVSDGASTEECLDNGGGDYTCGWEWAGELTITASGTADGFIGAAEGQATVTVSADECHVVTEFVALEVGFVCTDIGVPSAMVTVTDTDGTGIDGAAVSLEQEGTSDDCDLGEVDMPGSYICWSGATGDVTLRVDAEGYALHEEGITIGTTADGCHPDTADVTVSLAAE